MTSSCPKRTDADGLAPLKAVSVLRPSLPAADAIMPFLRRMDATRAYSNYGPLWRELHEGMAAWLAERTGAAGLHVVLTSSGTTAIELALRARAVPGRSLCLMPSFTFIASAQARPRAASQERSS